MPPALASCVVNCAAEVPEEEMRTRQEGPAEAVAGGAAGQDSVGEEGTGALEPERFEYAAAVADADCQNDSERQFKHIEVGLRKWELRRAQILQDEQRLRESRVASLNKIESIGAREQLRLDAMFLEQAVKRLDTKKMAAEIEVAAQAVDATLPVPGERDAGPLAKWRVGKKGRLMLVVPTATKPMSMFEPSFWSAYDPRSFPYGDGVFGVERRVALSFEEWGGC